MSRILTAQETKIEVDGEWVDLSKHEWIPYAPGSVTEATYFKLKNDPPGTYRVARRYLPPDEL